MNSFICLLIPALVGIKFYEFLRKEKFTYRDLIINYFILVLLINIFCTIVSILLFNSRTSIEISLCCFPIFAVKYVIIALVLAILVPIVLEIINKNINIDVEVKQNVKKNK